MNVEMLKACGVDYSQGIERCMNDEELFESVLQCFVEDDMLERTEDAFKRKDYSEMFDCVHELKGACGNAAFTELYDASCVLVELLRGGCTDDALIAPAFDKVRELYIRVRNGIIAASEKK